MPTLVMIGDGGHARVLLAALRLCGAEVLALAVPDLAVPDLVGVDRGGGARRIHDAGLLAAPPADYLLINGVGAVDVPRKRREVYERFRSVGFAFVQVLHPSAIVGLDVRIGVGAQVMAGAVVQSGAEIGENTIVNTRSVIEHDCVVGNHVHVATGAILTGGVRVGCMSMIGAGAVVKQGVAIGMGALIAAGAVVVRDVADGERVAGVPARPMRSRGA